MTDRHTDGNADPDTDRPRGRLRHGDSDNPHSAVAASDLVGQPW